MENPQQFIRPQEGFQMKFLSSSADIVIGGSAAGVGKTYALLLEFPRHIDNPGWGGVIFRRTSPQIKLEGGLWDTSMGLYPLLKAEPRESTLEWLFPNTKTPTGKGAKLKFAHLEYEKNVLDYQGSQIPFIGFDELTHFCITPDADVLTADGWKNITELTAKDKVASLNPKEEIEYKEVLKLHKFDYNGELKCLNQKNGVSFRVTPNHKVMVMKQLPNSKKEKGRSRMNGWRFREAKELNGCYIPRTGNFKGKKLKDFKLIKPSHRGHGINSNSVDCIKADAWLTFLGWYLSEGCCFTANNRTQSPIVSIRQTKLKFHTEISAMLDELGFRWKYRTDGNYMIFSRQLFDLLKPFGNRHEKRIPAYVFKASKKQQKLFWDAFVMGDGHIYKSGAVGIGLCNEGLIDDLQRVAFNIGLVATKGYSFTKTGFHVWRLSTSVVSNYNLVRKKDWYYEDYQGEVYCPEVKDNHNFYIRVNGRCCWTGNSEKMFFYLLSRNRSTCGIKPYVRATCNPDPESWVAKLIEWWIDQETGYPIPERDGVVRYFIRNGEKYTWGDSIEEVLRKSGFVLDKIAKENNIDPKEFVKSITFVSGSIYQNMELLKVNPGYLANLMSQDEATRSSLLDGNWKFVESDKDIYNYASFLGMFDDAVHPNTGSRRIIADIALQGSNKFVVAVFDGRFMVDMAIMDKSDGQQIINKIKEFQGKYYVANCRVLYDADGVGGFIEGFIPDSIAFHGNSAVLPTTDNVSGKTIKENYYNLKTQLVYHSGLAVSKGLYKISEQVRDMQYNEEMTVRQRMIYERKAFKKDKIDTEGKLRIISKEQMKEILLNESPDLMDIFFMNEFFEITIKSVSKASNWAGALR